MKDSIYLPEASLLLGRGVLEKKNKNRNDDNGSSYAPSTASSRMSTADFVNGGGDSTSRTSYSRPSDDPDDDPEGFVGFLSNIALHSKRISSGFAQSMVKDGETPLEPVEQDEWSLLVNASKRLQDDQERKKRQQRLSHWQK